MSVTIEDICIKQAGQGLLRVYLADDQDTAFVPRWNVQNYKGRWTLYHRGTDSEPAWKSKRDLAPVIHDMPALRQAVADEIAVYRRLDLMSKQDALVIIMEAVTYYADEGISSMPDELRDLRAACRIHFGTDAFDWIGEQYEQNREEAS